jgi:hypothetical protein
MENKKKSNQLYNMTDLKSEWLLFGLLILLLIPTLNYNFKIIFIIIIGYFILFPDKRAILYNNLSENLGLDKHKQENKKKDPNKIGNKLDILFMEGTEIIKELKTYKKANPPVYLSIKIAWGNFQKLSESIFINENMTYPQHIFSTLEEKRKLILNQMSSIIVNLESSNLQESSLTINRTLPLDNHIRILIRKMTVVLNHILDILSKEINKKWETTPYMEISPVEWNSPKPYNQDNLDIII